MAKLYPGVTVSKEVGELAAKRIADVGKLQNFPKCAVRGKDLTVTGQRKYANRQSIPQRRHDGDAMRARYAALERCFNKTGESHKPATRLF